MQICSLEKMYCYFVISLAIEGLEVLNGPAMEPFSETNGENSHMLHDMLHV